MKTARRPVRVSHLTLGIVLKRMRQGDFCVREITEISGYNVKTVYELFRTFERQGLISCVGRTKQVGPTGRRDKLFREVHEVLA